MTVKASRASVPPGPSGDRSPSGDIHGVPIAADTTALLAGGPPYLTEAFRAAGSLAPDNAVVAITDFAEWTVGATGTKLSLTVEYARAERDLPSELFVKFSRNFGDGVRDALRFHMEPEIRFAELSRAADFPVRVPACLYADFHRRSGTGILVTERIGFGSGDIEPHHPKCMDYAMDAPVEHYRVLVRALARLAGSHKAGRLPPGVAAQFGFDLEAALAAYRVPAADVSSRKIERLAAFAESHPAFLPEPLRRPSFLARLRGEAPLIVAQQDAIKRFLHADPDFIALCHWNANVDNAWFWREPDGSLACGLLDWGSVGQMHLAMTLLGCLSGGEPFLWDDHLAELLELFVEEFVACGGPRIEVGVLAEHLALYTVLMGSAYLLDAPMRIERELPDLALIPDRFDLRYSANETARVQLRVMVNFLAMWERSDVPELLRRAGTAI